MKKTVKVDAAAINLITEGLQAEIKSLMETSKKFQELITTAKTNLKKEIYTKKLKKNNQMLFNALILLRRHELDIAPPKESEG